VQPPDADLVGGHLVRQDDGGVRAGIENEQVDAVEQGAVFGRDRVDVLDYGRVHGHSNLCGS
jgi:hypothetical protein